MKPLYLKFVNTGIANRFDCGYHDVIEMNWRIKMYPEFFNEVLMHELSHDDDKSTVGDFKHDMKSRTPGLFKFMRNHISAWTQIIPFYYDIRKNKVVYDISAIISWFMVAGTAIGIYFLMKLLMGFIL